MNKRVALLLFSAFIPISFIFAQTIEDKKKVDIQNNTPVKAEEQISNIAPIHPSQGVSPFFYAYPLLLKNNPALTDFYRVGQRHLYKQFSLAGSSEKKSYAGLGEYISINGAIRWMPSQRFSIDAGGIFSRQFYFASPLFRQDIMGVNGRIQYTLTNIIRLNIWGQYIFPGEEFPFSAYNSLLPHTGVGASVSVDLKKNTEVSVGAEYQYDNKSKEWKLESSGRISIGF